MSYLINMKYELFHVFLLFFLVLNQIFNFDRIFLLTRFYIIPLNVQLQHRYFNVLIGALP